MPLPPLEVKMPIGPRAPDTGLMLKALIVLSPSFETYRRVPQTVARLAAYKPPPLPLPPVETVPMSVSVPFDSTRNPVTVLLPSTLLLVYTNVGEPCACATFSPIPAMHASAAAKPSTNRRIWTLLHRHTFGRCD